MNSVYFQTSFSGSAQHLRQLPEDAIAEVAFAGRSNAGKSSAINALTRSRNLARTSKTPGRTQLINHFLVRDDRYIVDLPGYGYAKVSKSKQVQWSRSLTDYLITREVLRCLVVVMDCRHPLTDTDWRVLEVWAQGTADLHVLLTKADKLSRNAANKALFSVRDTLAEEGIESTLQLFSAHDGQGLDDIHEVLDTHLFGPTVPSATDSLSA